MEEINLMVQGQGAMLLNPDLSKRIVELETTLKKLKEEEDQLKQMIIGEMEKNKLLKIDSEDLAITYVAASDRESFNAKEFRKDNPDLYDKYVEIKPVSPSIRLKVK